LFALSNLTQNFKSSTFHGCSMIYRSLWCTWSNWKHYNQMGCHKLDARRLYCKWSSLLS